VRTALIVRADDGTVGLRFLRSGGATAGPFQVTRLVPQGAAERSGAVEVGEHFRAVNGWDVTALDDAAVAGLFRGAPGTTLTLLLCDGPVSLNKRASEDQASEANLKEIEELEGEEYGQKRSALHIASEKGLESAVAKLLSLGADAAFKDEVRACSLAHEYVHWASINGLESSLAKLLSLGADAALKDKECNTALDVAGEEVKAAFAKHYAQVDVTDQNKNKLVLVLSRLGVASRLPAVLRAGADLKHTDERGITALMVACENKKEAAASELMEATKNAGALDVQDNNNKWSAMHWASINGLENAVSKLLSLGADAALKDKYGRTALMVACAEKNEEAAALLMEATKNAGALDVQGDYHPYRSALHIASIKGLESAVAKLVSLGADAALKDKVRACSHMNTCMCSVHVCIFVDALRMGISISITRIIL
jgi:ankyrin repeat protein